jgi:hypothetical protein
MGADRDNAAAMVSQPERREANEPIQASCNGQGQLMLIVRLMTGEVSENFVAKRGSKRIVMATLKCPAQAI